MKHFIRAASAFLDISATNIFPAGISSNGIIVTPPIVTLLNKEADGYVPITPEYNHSVSSALKNTLDYFLEEYFFKPSAIISYSVGNFGCLKCWAAFGLL